MKPIVRTVALLAEGVDRNSKPGDYDYVARVALLAEGVDRNDKDYLDSLSITESPSSRRAWIEISRP